MSDTEFLQDKKIQKIDTDIQQFKANLQKVEADLSGIDSRLNAEVERYHTAATAKRDAYDSMRGKLLQAEKEWHDADREFRNAQSQKNKGVGDVQRQAETLRRRIRDAERSRENRIRELQRGKQKVVDKAKKDKAKEMDRKKAEEVSKVEDQKRKELGLDR
ncbi:MAG: hypothetical protein C4K49_00105 [Candidatus Thorarchaeota archaeon]|nr:MAG: hypothetical protein C4K49_00105 [Candidatus Thorarchaeota archaeon]